MFFPLVTHCIFICDVILIFVIIIQTVFNLANFLSIAIVKEELTPWEAVKHML